MKFPVLFFGHGSPMLALENNEVSQGLRKMGQKVIDKYGKPKAILMISAHWYTDGTYIQTAKEPKQIYDMYGFPAELYEVKYPVKGYKNLSDRVQELLGNLVTVNDTWGIDHGTWTTLIHAYPNASIPVVQLSVNNTISEENCYKIGALLAPLRKEGYLIIANGNIVHNLQRVEWDNSNGSEQTILFNENVISLLKKKDFQSLIHYKELDGWEYAVPTPDHYLPFIYSMGAAGNEDVTVFNNVCNLGSMAMTSFAFGL